jgi:hypothetical protein
MTPREQKNTQAASLNQRLQVWETAIESSQNHVELGQTLQAQGIECLKSIQDIKVEISELSKLMQQASACIEKGINIERSAYRELLALHHVKPK